MIIIVSLLTSVIAFILITFTIGWWVHIDMTRDNTNCYGWANYDNFVREFGKYQWNNENWNGYSLWDREHDCKIHASIIHFENKGMVMKTPLDWVLANLYIRNYFKINKINFKGKKIIQW